jgi:arylsulfatase A-like enzyme
MFERRAFLCALGGVLSASRARSADRSKPNIIVILADDLGFGDLGCYGSSIPTPNLNRMAKEGARLTRFYSASPVCSPSRAALLTGRYPVRTGIVSVLMADSKTGLSPSEATIPSVLKNSGYRTSCFGKWHLGKDAEFAPNRHGFDEYYGVPYSNDMSPLPIMKNGTVVLDSCDQDSLTERFTDQAVDFIGRSTDAPFFMYLAYTAPHIPLAPAARFKGKSGHGIYGDIVMELDWSVGRVLEAVNSNGLDDNTLIIFTSDNGPWYQGSAGNLQGRKGSTYEGGVREPFIARMPGRIPAGIVCQGLSSAMDLLPTIAGLCGASLPVKVDGVDIFPTLTGDKPYAERDILLFFDGWQLQCARWGPWKLHFARYNSFAWTADPAGGRFNLPLRNPELYNVDEDPGESYDMTPEKPQVVANIKSLVEEMLLNFPDRVRTAWRDTVSQTTEETPVGALPQRKSN